MPDPMRQFRCPEKLWNEVKDLAAERDITVSQVLRRALKDYVHHHHEGVEMEKSNWIVQANSAKVWDVDRYAADHAGQRLREDWTIRQLGDEMQIGDWIAVWSAGHDGGVVAIGRVIGTPFDSAFVDDGYWIDPPPVDAVSQVAPLEVTWLRQPIGQVELKADPDFADALIVTMPGGKNPFRLTDTQRLAVERLNRG
jgi:hypothetical protein